MAKKRKFEVHAEDSKGDEWIVAAHSEETAAAVGLRFKADGLKNIRVIKRQEQNRHAPYATKSDIGLTHVGRQGETPQSQS